MREIAKKDKGSVWHFECIEREVRTAWCAVSYGPAPNRGGECEGSNQQNSRDY